MHCLYHMVGVDILVILNIPSSPFLLCEVSSESYMCVQWILFVTITHVTLQLRLVRICIFAGLHGLHCTSPGGSLRDASLHTLTRRPTNYPPCMGGWHSFKGPSLPKIYYFKNADFISVG